MKNRTIIAGAGVIALALGSQPAAAQDAADAMPQTAYDFVSMMLGLAPPGLIDYESLEPIGDEGFTMLGAVMTPPGEEESILINRVEVDRFDWTAIMADEEPAFLTATVTGIDIPAALFQEEVADIGYDFGDRVAAELAIDYERDDQSIDLRDLSISIPDVIRLAFSLDAGGVPDAMEIDNPMMAAGSARLSNFSFTLEDLGGLEEIIAASAQEFGMDGGQVVELVQAQAPMAEMMLQGERGSAIAATLITIVQDLPNLANPVTISLSPDEPLTLADFMAAEEQDPEMIITRMGLGIDY